MNILLSKEIKLTKLLILLKMMIPVMIATYHQLQKPLCLIFIKKAWQFRAGFLKNIRKMELEKD